jgi:membrane protein required for colicin V production
MSMSIAWVDIALVALLLLSMVLGMIRGLVFEMLALAGWVVALLAAQWITPRLSSGLPVGAPGSVVNHAATFGLIFVGTLFVWALLAWLINRLVRASAVSAVDRTLGAAFGLVRGVLIALVVEVLVLWTPVAHSASWKESHGAAVLQRLLAELKPHVPQVLAERLP